MSQKDMFRQVLEFNKNIFQNTFNSMAALQDQAESMGSMMLDKAAWMPNEGKKLAGEWMQACKKGREEFKNAVEGGFKTAETFLEE